MKRKNEESVANNLRIDILTLFPEVFGPYLKAGLLGKALEQGL